jgi:hypothetical protein
MAEEGGQIIIEMFVDKSEILFKVVRYTFHIWEDFLEVFFYDRKDPSEFDVPHPADYVIGYGVVLIPDQKRELYVQALHELFRFASGFGRLA